MPAVAAPASIAPADSAEPAGASNEKAGSAAVALAPGPAAGAALDGKRLSSAEPKARARQSLARSGGKTAQQVKRSAPVRAKAMAVPVRSKALARTRLRSEGRVPKRKLAASSVEQRLEICKAKAGEAAAACYARACRSYARKALICINDEPAQRRR